ncbi:MAG TPA: hypothetical protein VE172_09155 [Stackebrandtia sp.]|jgi:hypothetical protein|uniref:hypothetical protein n=1 Tax=Stackebrandtia sp. TaxID=2023065 RepID=UPI002D516C44|nr:hypothetical protein [Stackebrandtia sp.]HZE38964.1 hypothetical protein [Stackebrandtia sp.]
MSIRAVSAVSLALVLLLAGCKSNDDGSSAGGDNASGSSDSSKPKYTDFKDFPGDELSYSEGGTLQPVPLRLKVVDSQWSTELGDHSAKVGSHYLVLYIAATSGADDRGAQHVGLNVQYTGVKFKADNPSDCEYGQGDDGCTYASSEVSDLDKKVEDNTWRDHLWIVNQYSYVDIAPKETLIGALAIEVSDKITGVSDVQFCAASPTKGTQMYPETFPCMSLNKQPKARK